MLTKINLHDLLGLIREMLFNLAVAKFKDLKLVREGSLRCLCLGEEVDNFSVLECLLDVLVVEVNYCVSIWEGLTLDTVVENYFFLAILIDALDLTIVANILLDNFLVRQRLAMILLWEFEAEVFFFIFKCCTSSVLPLLSAFVQVRVSKHTLTHLFFILLVDCISHGTMDVALTSSNAKVIVEYLIGFFLV